MEMGDKGIPLRLWSIAFRIEITPSAMYIDKSDDPSSGEGVDSNGFEWISGDVGRPPTSLVGEQQTLMASAWPRFPTRKGH